ncbi:hypothetical protein [Streptomyces sp. BE133]|uniref:hypothetical protein n=1 Tax=Streptomyces sp. BE133 TaxID=3002523 RepID=UPI002E790BFE|nr:hypothetical protein [Streptomyces sp. BE133]MEE1805821.1 hypothetical protein [Streptomyces sp. BE133]
MRMKIVAMTVSVLMLGGVSQAPAQASGGADDGPTSIGVIGDGLRVREVRALIDDWEPGAAARISQWKGDSYIRQVSGWKAMSSKQVSRLKFEIALWKFNRNFPHGHRLCAEFKGHPDRLPCVTIKR